MKRHPFAVKFSPEELEKLRAAAARRWPNGKAAGFPRTHGSVGEFVRLSALLFATADDDREKEKPQQQLPLAGGAK